MIAAFTRRQSDSNVVVNLCLAQIEALQSEPEMSLPEKSHLVLEHVAKRTGHFGESVNLRPAFDFPVVKAKNHEEFRALIGMHVDNGNLNGGRPVSDGSSWHLALTGKGVAVLEEMRRVKPNAETAFVAMWFDSSMTAVYSEHIAPAIIDAGYRPVRADIEEHNDDIMVRVFMGIRDAKFIVADFTGHRNGVYFEAGYAKGLGREVIWLVREDQAEGCHFDTEHFNHLKWSPACNLRAKLTSKILATVEPGPLLAAARGND